MTNSTDIQERETIALLKAVRRMIREERAHATAILREERSAGRSLEARDVSHSRDAVDLAHAHLMNFTVADCDRAILALRSNPQPGSEGWKLVPVEPADEMLSAPDDHGVGLYSREVFKIIYRAMLAASPTPPTAQPGEVERLRSGWLPVALCPTDGADRALLLPDGREVVGAHHNPGGWRVASSIEVDRPVYGEVRGGLLPMTLKPYREPERTQTGTRKETMRLYGALPEGVYPTHFRPNDTVYGSARAALTPSESQSNG